ncbi:MAG: hypothetical protein ACHQJX_15655, partial [Candidatus Acidiferrales bacterium]
LGVKWRYLATFATMLVALGVVSLCVWTFLHRSLWIALPICAASVGIGFVVVFWIVGRVLPSKIHSRQ